MSGNNTCPTLSQRVGQKNDSLSKQKAILSHCPTLLGGGTVGQEYGDPKSGTDLGTEAGQGSIKALAQAFLAVPLDRDKVGQGVGQAEKSCPTPTGTVGQEIVPVTIAAAGGEPTPEQIAHARRMLVNCPFTGGKLHCWHCSRCDDAGTCRAWRIRRRDVELFRNCEAPYSLFLVESGATEVSQ